MEPIELLNAAGGWTTAVIILIYLWKLTKESKHNGSETKRLVNQMLSDAEHIKSLSALLKESIPRMVNILDNQTQILIRMETKTDELLSRMRSLTKE